MSCWTSGSGLEPHVTRHAASPMSAAPRRLYHVLCDDAVARRRCMARNDDGAASFLIDEAAFDDLRSKFEPLGPDEPAEIIDTTDT
jgi:hypothetical protein